jgi:hypothetical protein
LKYQFVNQEFQEALDDGVYDPAIVANIDDIYEDKKEEEEPSSPIDHSGE